MSSRQSLLDVLANYLPWDEHESEMVQTIRQLLATQENCLDRLCMPGHLTASAWVVSRNPQSALLIHHAKLGKWLQPGGHADGNADLESVARRELLEETGLNLDHIPAEMFDVDVHLIPARGAVEEHFHHDVRFRFWVDAPLEIQINHEVNEARWVSLDEIPNWNDQMSIIRMVQKSIGVRNKV